MLSDSGIADISLLHIVSFVSALIFDTLKIILWEESLRKSTLVLRKKTSGTNLQLVFWNLLNVKSRLDLR